MREINPLQRSIVVFIRDWANSQKTPVPRKEIIRYMVENKVSECTVINAIHSLITKGYIRRGYSPHVAVYVMTRNL